MRAFSLFLLLLCGSLEATTIQVSGRQLLVNCQPFIARGMNYKPTPYSGGANWGDDWTLDAAVCSADFVKMQEMGSNFIRVYVEYSRLFNNWDNHDPGADTVVASELSRYQAVLNDARNRGIYVLMHYWLPFGANYMAGPNPREWNKTRFKKIINLFKDSNTYPNVLMWGFSNENNFDFNRGPLTKAQLYDYFQEVIADAKANADATHPYTVSLGDNGDINDVSLTSRVPSIDVWGLNIYQFAGGYDFVIANYAVAKPLLFTEFGHDAWNGPGAGGSVDQVTQSNFYQDRWANRIGPNLSALDSSRKLVGGCVFEWSDEWWKDPAGTLTGHDYGGWAGNMENDGFLNEEWFGLATALAGGVSGPRTYRQGFTTLKNLWTAAPYNTTPPSSCFTPTRTRTPCPACTATFTATRTPTPDPCGPVEFDRFDDGNLLNSLGGTWGWAQQSGGATLSAGGAGYSGNSLVWTYTTAAGWSVIYAPSSATADPAGAAGAGTGAVNLGGYGRIQFRVKASAARDFWIKVASNTNMGGGYNWYRAPFSATTAWTLVSLDLNGIVFQNPGGNSGTFAQNLAATTQFVFETQTLGGGASTLEIDEVELTPACGVPTYTQSPSPSRTATRSFTHTRSITPTNTPTPSRSMSATATPSLTQVPAGSSNTHSPTRSPSHSHTPTRSPSFTASPTPPPAYGLVFEDFETGGISGGYQYDDAGGSSIAYAVTTSAKDGSYGEALRVTTSGGAWGAGHGLASSYANGAGVVDASGAQYLRVFIKTDKTINLSLSFKEGQDIPGPNAANEVWESAPLTLTASAQWQVITLPLSAFVEGLFNPDCQPNCATQGNNVRDLSLVWLVAFQFNVNAATLGANVLIDNIEFVYFLHQSPTQTRSPTGSPTLTRSPTMSPTPSRSATSSPGSSPSFTRTPTGSGTPSPAASASLTGSLTSTRTLSPTATGTGTPTGSRTPTGTGTASPASSPSATPSLSATPSRSRTPTGTLTRTPPGSPTPSASASRTDTPVPPGSSATASPTLSGTATGTGTSSPTATRSPTLTLSTTPSLSMSPTRSPSPTATSSPSGTLTLTSTPSHTPSATLSSTELPPGSSATASPSPSRTMTATASGTPSGTWTRTRTASPSFSPTAAPSGTMTPSRTATFSPTSSPVQAATGTATPTASPTSQASPSSSPSPGTMDGILAIEEVLPLPNPNPGFLAIKLSGHADRLRLKVYTKALACTGTHEFNGQGAGRSLAALGSRLDSLPNGLYYFVLIAERNSGAQVESAPGKLMIMK